MTEVEQTQVRSESSLLERLNLRGWDAGAVSIAAFTIVLFVPPMMFPAWTPRVALILAVIPTGAVVLAALMERQDRPAEILLAALLWTVVAAIVSDEPRSALVGTAGRDLSALVVVGGAACWAVGRMVSVRGRAVLAIVITAASALGALVGLLQVILDPTAGALALAAGRPAGLTASPVYFGAMCAAGLLCCAAAWTDLSARLRWPSLVLLGMGVSLSGSRVALVAALLSLVALVSARRSRDSAIAASAALAAIALGVGCDRLIGAGRNAADRLVSDGGGGRTIAWKYGLRALGERPVAGYGFGRFRPATQQDFSADFVRAYASDEVRQAWFDAHNVLVGLLVSVGIVGTVLFFGWALLWSRRIRGPLAWILLPLALHWLLQPVSLYTVPLALLAFGAASEAQEPILERRHDRLIVASICTGLVLAITLVALDVTLRRAANKLDGEAAAQIAELVGGDAVVDDIVAQVYAASPEEPGAVANELKWRNRAATDEPDRPFWWSALALKQLERGDIEGAQRSLAVASALQPHNTRTAAALAELAYQQRDVVGLERALREMCLLGRDEACSTDAADAIAAADGR